VDAPVTFRLDPKTRRRILRAARRKGVSQSEVIRRALNSWPELNDTGTEPYVLISDLMGVVRGGDPKRSEKAGKKFRTLLTARRNRQ